MANTKDEKSSAEEKTEIQIDKFDGAALKNTLDDAVSKYMLKTISLKEDLTFNNLKLLFGFACCAFALVAQFYPKPFPDNKVVLIICCSSYIVISAIMQIIATFFESDIILRTKSFGKSKSIVIRTQLPRFQDIYTISYEYNGQPASKVELKSSVTSWFDSNGVFSQESFFKDLASLHSKLQQKKNA